MANLLNRHRDTQRRVGFRPDGLVGPVIIRVRPVDDGIERGVMFLAREDVLGFLVLLVANAVRSVPVVVMRKYSGWVRASPLPLVITSKSARLGWMCS